MLQRFGTGIRLAGASWRVLKADKSLAIFPIVSTIFALLAILLILAPAGLTIDWNAADPNSVPPAMYAWGLLAGYVSTVIAVFHNVALAACASRSLEGHDTSVGDGYSVAFSRLGTILGWSLIALTVGLILRFLDGLADRAPFPFSLIANIGVWLLGAAWAAVTFLVVPVLALEDVGPREALSRSKTLVLAKWGEGIAGNVGINFVTGLIGFLALVIGIGGGVMLGATGTSAGVAAGLTIGALGIIVFISALIVGATLTQVFAVSLYRYASTGETVGGFSSSDMDVAFVHRRTRR